MKGLIATEHQEQSMLFQWAAVAVGQYPDLEWLYAIPNFSGRLGKAPPMAAVIQAVKLNREGRKKGYPDIGLDVARGPWHGLRIEMKRSKGGVLKPEQQCWHKRLREQDYLVAVCKGWEEARDILVKYLTLSPYRVGDKRDEQEEGHIPIKFPYQATYRRYCNLLAPLGSFSQHLGMDWRSLDTNVYTLDTLDYWGMHGG